MKINITADIKNTVCDILVVNQFEGEKTTEELANKYAIDEDKFEGKLGKTYYIITQNKSQHF